MTLERLHIHVTGRVQGVGFRPTMYRYARERGLAGWVSNTSEGVIIEVEGEPELTADFLNVLKTSPPPMAVIEGLEWIRIPALYETAFEIRISQAGTRAHTQISPDLALCTDCRRELQDPSNRRYRYPFINCTNCGPRFTIIQGIPYDRPFTTMSGFTMCALCRMEYENPMDRRFHAQPNACPDCGPRVSLMTANGEILAGGDAAMRRAAESLVKGHILAVKGLGGYHLACDARSSDAVHILRSRKRRWDKPFALMGRGIEVIRSVCEVSSGEEEILRCAASPVVLLKKRTDAGAERLADEIAPRNSSLGFMLPYTPLHTVLIEDGPSILVMTSGNYSQEPIAWRDGEAREYLSGIADFFLVHNRPIHTRCDDSVTRVIHSTGKEMMLRRSRGHSPSPLRSPFRIPAAILACGGHFNNVFALGRDDEVYMSHHIGDMENLEALNSFETGVSHLETILDIKPEVIAYDMHPDYLSTQYAEKRAGRDKTPVVRIQHHHAHIASCMADCGLPDRPVIGVAFDGTGYGTDGTIWGGEFLVTDYGSFRRAAHLRPVPMPGGDAAVREPWRMAAVHLHETFGGDFPGPETTFTRRLNKDKWKMLDAMIRHGVNSPLTSSMGRLFDAVAALIGIRDVSHYHGQAAIELEQKAHAASCRDPYEFSMSVSGSCLEIETTPVIRALVRDLEEGVDAAEISARFHVAVVIMTRRVCAAIRDETGIGEAALSGGVFQNMILLDLCREGLVHDGFRVHIHEKVPPNDGGIALGQTLIAARMMKE